VWTNSRSNPSSGFRFQLPRPEGTVWDVAFKLGSDFDHRGDFIYRERRARRVANRWPNNAQSLPEVDLRAKRAITLAFRLSDWRRNLAYLISSAILEAR